MGGIGKTTIARQIYHKLALQFGSSILILNVQEEIERHGICHIRSQYLLELQYERLKRTKVLLILDDVNDSAQLTDLIGGRGNFGQGSRFIVTIRDKQVLKNAEAEIYEVKEMNFQDSLKLFSLHAFKQNHPRETYMDLSVKVLNYAKGIPLALQILGSLLYGRTEAAWESELKKLEKYPDLKIFNVLKLSYDGLDEEQKDIFLDIACFRRGHEAIVVAETLDSCGFSAKIGMDVLKDRCLISVLEGRVVMHDLIQEMGQEIVRQQCLKNPGERSRLWKLDEIHQVLSKNKGSDAIQCILLDICKIKKVELDTKTFEKMDNLRMLQFCKSSSSGYWSSLGSEPGGLKFADWNDDSNVFLASSLESLPDGLKVLRWDDFPQRSLPPNFCPENLVRLEMPHCHLEQLWEGNQDLPNLKRLDLRYSRELIGIPDLYLSPNIEEIILSKCEKLNQVYSSGFLSKLKFLCLIGCVELRSLTIPSNILSGSPGLILLSGCGKLERFSISESPLYFRSLLISSSHQSSSHHSRFGRGAFQLARGTLTGHPDEISSITFDRYEEEEKEVEAPSNIQLVYTEVLRELREGVSSIFSSFNEFCWLDLSLCKSLTSLSFEFDFDFSKLKFLKELHLRGCSNLEKFPEIEDTMENLAVLILDLTAIQALPSSLCHLVGLEELSLHGCSSLEIIPSSIGSLSKLCKLGLTYCESLQTFPSSIFKLKLTKLDLRGCTMLRTFPEILELAETFAHVNLTETAIKELPSSLDNLVGLRTLHLNMCTDLESLPNSIVNLNLLSKLDCSGCGKLTEIPRDIGRLSLLMELSLSESGIVNLPESISQLSSLKSLDLSDCKKLECIPQLPPFLKQLLALDCPSIRKVMSNSLIQIPSNSKEGVFKFHFTNGQQLDPDARANIMDDAWLRMTEDAYRTLFFCFPGSAVPHWFPFRGDGHSVTINADSLKSCSDDRLIGFALSVVFQLSDTNDIEGRYGSFSYSLKFESDDGIHILPNNDLLRNHFYWKDEEKKIDQDHTFLWKYNTESERMSCMSLMPSHARSGSFTFEISPYDYGFQRRHSKSIVRELKSVVTIKECGICPLYNKKKDDNNAVAGDNSGFMRFSKNDIEEPSRSNVA